jgi:uncharacterized Fe-S center protein
MSKVYFSKDLDKLLEKIDFSKLGNNVAIKVHFGEKGYITYLNHKLIKKVYDKIIGLGMIKFWGVFGQTHFLYNAFRATPYK